MFYLKARDRNGRQITRRLGPAHAGRGAQPTGSWTRKQAEDELRDWLTDLGRTPDGPASAVTLGDAARAWLHYVEHERERAPSTVRDYRNTINRRVVTFYAALDDAGISRDQGTGKPFVFSRPQTHLWDARGAGVPAVDVQAYMGHADIDTAMLYVHHTPQHDAADRLNAWSLRLEPRSRTPHRKREWLRSGLSGAHYSAVRRFSEELRCSFPERLSLFDEYQDLVEAWEERFRRFERVAQAEERAYARTQRATAEHILALQATVLSARVVNLANGVVVLLNARNAHSVVPVARALFETCAVPLYMRRNLLPRLRKGKVRQVHALLYRLGLGTYLPSDIHTWKPIDVDQLINAMAREIDAALAEIAAEDERLLEELDLGSYGAAIRLTYSLLSEYTHPNQPAMTTSTAVDAEGFTTWTLQPAISQTTLSNTARPGWFAMLASGAALDEVMLAASEHEMVLPEGPPDFAEADLK